MKVYVTLHPFSQKGHQLMIKSQKPRKMSEQKFNKEKCANFVNTKNCYDPFFYFIL
jgi:hypothetical protein